MASGLITDTSKKLEEKDSNDKLEARRIKEEIRLKLSFQCRYFLQHIHTPEKVVIHTLPGKHWTFEKTILDFLLSFPNTKFLFNCFESKKRIFESAIPPIPNGEFLNNCVMNYVRGWFKYDSDLEKETLNIVKLIWRDLCGWPTTNNVKDFELAIQNSRYNYIHYETFDVRWRTIETIDPRIRAKIELGMSNEQALLEVLEEIIRKKYGNGFTKIFYYHYVGGGNTPMVTIGWHFTPNSLIPEYRYIKPEKSEQPKTPRIKSIKNESFPIETRKKVQKLVWDGINNKDILEQFKITPMQLAGIKAYISKLKNQKKELTLE